MAEYKLITFVLLKRASYVIRTLISSARAILFDRGEAYREVFHKTCAINVCFRVFHAITQNSEVLRIKKLRRC